MEDAEKPKVAIVYCTQCNWLLRAAWMAQELLSTFPEELGSVALVPGTGRDFRDIGRAANWSGSGGGTGGFRTSGR